MPDPTAKSRATSLYTHSPRNFRKVSSDTKGSAGLWEQRTSEAQLSKQTFPSSQKHQNYQNKCLWWSLPLSVQGCAHLASHLAVANIQPYPVGLRNTNSCTPQTKLQSMIPSTNNPNRLQCTKAKGFGRKYFKLHLPPVFMLTDFRA